MGYNRENFLRRVIEIQDIVLEYKKNYIPQVRIYELYIRDQYHISMSTFNTYLGIPAKSQLKDLLSKKENKERAQDNQTKLPFEEE